MGDRMTTFKCFEEENIQDLENALNDFIDDSIQVIDIRLTCYQLDDDIYFVCILMYEEMQE